MNPWDPLDKGGLQMADLKVKIITPEVENSLGLLQGEPSKGER